MNPQQSKGLDQKLEEVVVELEDFTSPDDHFSPNGDNNINDKNLRDTISHMTTSPSINSFMDEFTDPSSTDGMLLLRATGFMGFLERIPLSIKLVVMCIVSIVGLFVFVALTLTFTVKQVKGALIAQDAVEFMSGMDVVINALQNERLALNRYLVFPYDETFLKMAKDAATATDQAERSLRSRNLETMKKRYGRDFEKTVLMFRTPQNELSDLFLQRELAFNRTSPVGDNYVFYQLLISDMLVVQAKVTELANLNYKGASYILLSRLIETQDGVRNLGGLIFSNRMLTLDFYTGWISSKGQASLLENIWLASVENKIANSYKRLVLNDTTAGYISEAESYIFDEAMKAARLNLNVTDMNKVDAFEYTDIMNLKISKMRQVQSRMLNDLLSVAQDTKNQSVIDICVFCVLAFLFAILSIATAMVLAGTIIAPWRRLNKIQETAIARFVPRGFLKLLDCNRITDVTLGMHVEKDNLTMMEVEIQEFPRISQQMKSEQVFNLLNAYLNFVGPLIRKNGGFIQSYQGEKFTALFREPTKGVKSSIEIQSAIDSFNIGELYPRISVGTSVHTGSALVGTVGENERMDGTVISRHSQVKALLGRLALKLATRTLTTNSVMECCGKWVKHFQYRRIGTIVSSPVESSNNSSEKFDVFELLHSSDSGKIETRDLFQTAVDHFQNGFYSDAKDEFEQIYEKNKQDQTTTLYLARAQQLYNQTRLIVQSLQMRDVLNDGELLEAFDKFCTAEHSNENISIWRKIEEYKKIDKPDDRVQFAQKLYNDYLSLNGLYAVNINESMKKQVSDQLNSVNAASTIDSSLYNGVQKELEILMGTDTLSRFKASQLFKIAFQKSSLSINTPLLHEL